MIVLRDKLFSKPKGKEETDHQKKTRKRLSRELVVTGTGMGIMAGGMNGDLKSDKIMNKGLQKVNNIAREFNKDVDRASEWTSKAMKVAKNPKEVLNYAENAINQRGAKARKDIDRINKVARKSANKAFFKSIGKGAAIGTAVAAPLAIAANKKMKKNNEKLNAKRRGIKE